MKSKAENYHSISKTFWNLLGGHTEDLRHLHFSGPESVLASRFDVTSLASATIGIATLAVAELKSVRSKSNQASEFKKVNIDSIEACAAYKGDSLFTPIGWQVPALWDPFAGDYQSADRWIRLHTNYSYHRDAVFKVLGKFNTKEELAAAVLKKNSSDLEQSIFEAGGCSAVMYDRKTWQNHLHGRMTLDEKIIHQTKLRQGKARFSEISERDLPLNGIRLLDMTRVIAGPTCTKFLSAYGADVLRIDPVNFAEVEGLLPETTVGKRRSFLDIKTLEGRNIFEKLIQEAHVFVHGLRPDALEKLGIDANYLAQLNPTLISASLNAYGSKGPWKNKRGFDSLVQMSSGIAAAGANYKQVSKPVPLPVQALDHGAGYIMAASVCRSLTELYRDNQVNETVGSLIGASNILQQFAGDFEIEMPPNSLFANTLIEEKTNWGPAFRVRCPGTIDAHHANWVIPAGPLGKDVASF